MKATPPWPGAWTDEGLCGYARHVGPLWSDGADALALRIETRHTNRTGRLHGGMGMGLVAMALAQAAQRAVQAARPGATAVLLTQQCELIDSAFEGEWVVAEARLLRTTRTLVFLTAQLCHGERVLLHASAVFQIEADAHKAAVPSSAPAPQVLPPGYALREPVDAFSAHLAPIHERIDAQGERFGGFHVTPAFLDAQGGGGIDNGMLLLLADLFLGRRARMSSGWVCVTVGMGISRLAPVRLGDWVTFDSRAEGQNGETVVATGHFRVNERPVMSATSLWKMVEKL
ncbi:hotdog domain-containing protein [Hydrogenophaga sp.]|uniref:PaaI family thioesterase n=1 Tax=Hydrogenophaga sp. TaxID=1904254 RepID=UPI002636BEE4|nr:hotdog domain-containing protein [Hydrogenophaga sp.]MCW5653194.1 thioesterase family protein [Hydrogenophaga sp.]